MKREELTRIICPSFMTSNCENQVDCSYCTEKTNKWLEEYEQQIRAEVIEEIALKIQKIKDNHNENPRLYPINYGTICGICTDLWEQLKENK